MAQKALENAVRDLNRSVCELAIKVTELECKITEQNAIITVQTDTISKLKLAFAGTSTSTSRIKEVPKTTTTSPTTVQLQATQVTTQALQRPVRQARLNAAQKVALSAAGKSRPSIDSPLLSQPDNTRLDTKSNIASPSNTASNARTTSARPAQTGESMKTTDCTTKTTEICVATKQTIATDGSDKIQHSADWTFVPYKRQTKTKVVTGERKDATELQTVERLKHIQAWSFSPETTEQNILSYLNKLLPCKDYTVVKRQLKTNKHSAFVIGFPESLYDRMCSPSSWPQNVKLSDWFLRRPRSPRGNTSSTLAASASLGPSTTASTSLT